MDRVQIYQTFRLHVTYTQDLIENVWRVNFFEIRKSHEMHLAAFSIDDKYNHSKEEMLTMNGYLGSKGYLVLRE